MKQKTTGKMCFSDLNPEEDFGIGSIGAGRSKPFRYIFTGRKEAYLVVFRHGEETPTGTGIYVVTEEDFKELQARRAPLDGNLDDPIFKPLERVGGKLKTEDAVKLFDQTAAREEKKDEEAGEDAEVQTQEEAGFANSPEMVKSVMEMFETGCGKIEADRLTHLEVIEMKSLVEKVAYTEYLCTPAGGLIPSTILWHPKYIIFKVPKKMITEITKKLIYENIKKSSKRSYGLGLNLMPQPPDLLGPKEGDPVYKNGKPQKASDGAQISFNYNSSKQWARLRIEAEMKIKEDFQGFEITTIPPQE